MLAVPLVHDLCPFWIQAEFLQCYSFSRVEISNWEARLGHEEEAEGWEESSKWEGADRLIPAPIESPDSWLLFLVLAKSVHPKFSKQMFLRGEEELNLLLTKSYISSPSKTAAR